MRTIERGPMALATWSEEADRAGRARRRPDVRGLPVRTLVDGRPVGSVCEVLVDQRRVPRYLDLRLDALDKHVLLPIGQAHLDRSHAVVWIPGLSESGLEPVPAYDHRAGPAAVTRADEASIVATFHAVHGGGDSAPRPYAGRLEGPSSDADDRPAGRVMPLDALDDWHVADAEPDPRGWTVMAADARPVATVDELLVDTTAMKVRYFVCDIDEAGLGRDRGDRLLLVPAGLAHIDESRRVVLLPGLRTADIDRLPVYTGDRMEHEIEKDLTDAAAAGGPAPALYDAPRFDPGRFFGPETP